MGTYVDFYTIYGMKIEDKYIDYDNDEENLDRLYDEFKAAKVGDIVFIPDPSRGGEGHFVGEILYECSDDGETGAGILDDAYLSEKIKEFIIKNFKIPEDEIKLNLISTSYGHS